MRYCRQSLIGDVMKVTKVSWVTYTGRCVPVSAKGPVINYGEGWGLQNGRGGGASEVLPIQKKGGAYNRTILSLHTLKLRPFLLELGYQINQFNHKVPSL